VRHVPKAAASCAAAISILIANVFPTGAAQAAAPPIRLSPTNQVPACVTPAALNRFLADQNIQRGHRLLPHFRDIARHYQRHGITHRVRWDYAFFQMALETNFLSFRRGNGRPGDVHPNQNNFAGLGTTGGGVPGDRYPNVSTGVLAQIQHLVVYSGERLSNPVGHRTRLKQDVILKSVGGIARRRPVTFADLARRWAADRRYGRSIQRLAGLFFSGYCKPGTVAHRKTAPRPPALPGARTNVKQRQAGIEPSPQANSTKRPQAPRVTPQPVKSCEVQIASYGGHRAVLIETIASGAVKLTALNVHPGFEVAMAANFIQTYAPQGRTIGAYPSRKAALAKAHSICRARRRQ